MGFNGLKLMVLIVFLFLRTFVAFFEAPVMSPFDDVFFVQMGDWIITKGTVAGIGTQHEQTTADVKKETIKGQPKIRYFKV